MNPVCLDLLGMPNASDSSMLAQAALRDATGNQSIEVCAEVAEYCNILGGPGSYARLFCPTTCGCDSWTSSIALPHPNHGCSESCSKTLSYLEGRKISPCKDADEVHEDVTEGRQEVLTDECCWSSIVGHSRSCE